MLVAAAKILFEEQALVTGPKQSCEADKTVRPKGSQANKAVRPTRQSGQQGSQANTADRPTRQSGQQGSQANKAVRPTRQSGQQSS
jgi:hypothetical protein